MPDPHVARVRMACGVPDDEALWLANWLFYSPLTARPAGSHDSEGFGFSGLFGELSRARAAYAELRAVRPEPARVVAGGPAGGDTTEERQ